VATRSIVWLGVRTSKFAEMVALYRDALELELIHETRDAAWFRMADGNEVHVYAQSDEDHDFFGAGPVPGFLVDDFAAARERLIAAGAQFIGEPQRDGGAVWNHYRAPDGNIYEIMQRGVPDSTDVTAVS
jgi:catechol 2,3-dioxygenase-like lactoylglutathione lyase family enzyme